MILFYILFGAVICGAFVVAWAKSLLWIINKIEYKKENRNPYVKEHENRVLNDSYYEDYLKWLDEKGGGLPIDKIKSKEEKEFLKKIN